MKLAALTVLAALGCADERPHPGNEATGRIHPVGILDEDHDNFHGRELARRDWDFGLCAKCHGEDFAGGAADVSCMTCHAEGPTACATCHREDVETAAHAAHRTAGVGCDECHAVPASWDAEGHIVRDGVADRAPAEVAFGARAAATIDVTERAGPPAFTSGRCTNVYCHGDVLGAAGGVATQPRWNAPIAPGCDRCHGAPPPSHAQDPCTTCHPHDAAHIDGVVQIGRTAGCDGCHGRGGDPAPPRDLDGNEFTTAVGVGAHRAHLDGMSRVRGPIACATCHVVPASLLAPGHLDSTRPAEVTAGLGWNRASGTCATAWCHGAATPVWTAQGGASCGTCHAVPPATPAHASATSLSTCAACHPRVIDALGNFLFANGVSEHLDGDVDVD